MQNEKHPEKIGYCEGLCGGLLSHHLIDGLCPICRADRRIASPEHDDYDDVPLGVESFNLQMIGRPM